MEAAPDAVETPPYDMEVEDIGDSEVSYFGMTTEHDSFRVQYIEMQYCFWSADVEKSRCNTNRVVVQCFDKLFISGGGRGE